MNLLARLADSVLPSQEQLAAERRLIMAGHVPTRAERKQIKADLKERRHGQTQA